MLAFLSLNSFGMSKGLGLYTIPKGAEKSNLFNTTVNGKEVFTEKFKDVNYVRFSHTKAVSILVKSAEDISSFRISPQKDIISPKANGKSLEFSISKPGYYVVTINNKEKLFVLSDTPDKDKLKKSDFIDVKSYNIDFTGTTIVTEKLQNAINDAISKNKTLVFSAGIYRTGTLKIGSNARIYIADGAMIKGSESRNDYPTDGGKKESDHINDKANYTDNGETMTFSRLILIDNAENVKIWGDGVIDGSGSIVRAQGKPANLIRIRNSKNIELKGLVLRDPACWNTHILKSENVVIRNIKMLNDPNVPNTDGFDPDASKNVLIEDCFAYCSDDNIAIKTTNNGGLLQDCENIKVNNCVFLTRKSSLKVGTETKGKSMRNIVFSNNYVVEADRGLALYCYDGATFENIQFINNYIERNYPDSRRKAIHFEIKNRNGAGTIKNVLIKDCSIGEGFSKGSEMLGLDANHTIDGVVFKNLKVDGELCLQPEKLRLTTNKFVKNIRFEK
ncbi:glycoside hydrolase family 28 protein [Pseudopedobacter saltans]|nr:glycosyl hydrolase family 28 protein [Pseudopedobacter saltans]